MLHLVSGRIKSGKTSYIIEKIRGCHGTQTLLVVPEQYSHSMERLLCEKCGNRVAEFAEVTSFRRLGTKVKGEVGGFAAQIIGGGRRILTLHSAVLSVSAELRTLAKTACRPERLGEILSAIDEFKAYGVSPEEIARVSSEVSGRLGEKLRDLSIIYAAYENALGEDFYDAYDELAFVSEKISESKFFSDKVVFFDGFSGFTSTEFDIIASAISHAEDVYIALETPKVEDKGAENGIFDKAFETKKQILDICSRVGAKYDEVHLETEATDVMLHLDHALFSDVVEKFDGVAENITIARADTVFEECELAAAYIIDNVRQKKFRYRDFSVAVTNSADYLSTCEMVLSRYGIPVYVAAAKNIVSKPAVAVILAAFECALRGFKTDAVMEYIKTGFSGICARSLDIFENYLYTWNPKPSMWRSKQDFTKNPLGLGKDETAESLELLRVVNSVRKKIFEPIERLRKAIESGKTGEKCAEALYAFINEINIPRRCNAYAYLAECNGNLGEAQEYSRVMDILCDAIDSIGRAVGDEILEIEDLYLLFRIVISQYELDTIPASIDCVSVDELNSADGGRCRVRMILGANDGVLPSSGDGTGILSDSDRAALSDYGIELAPGMTERIFEQYRNVHNVICSGEEAVYISSRASGESGEESAEATAVTRIREVFDGIRSGLTLHEARLRAKIPCFDENVASGDCKNQWANDSEYSEKLLRIKENVSGKRGPILDRENIDSVFGKKISMSASRADLFCSCRYAYFLKYGLYAKKRERAEISAVEAGTLMHDVLEKVIAKLIEDGDFSVSSALVYAKEACGEYVRKLLGNDGEVSGRMEFLLKRLETSVEHAIRDICREIEKSEFRPKEVELKFKKYNGDLPEIEICGEHSVVALNGAVDRIDTYENEGKMYFRVIDYKSGTKEFSLDETVNGIGMQMLLYMFAIEEMGRERFGSELHSAGVMYVPISRSYSNERGVASGTKRREGVVLRDMDVIDAMECGENKEYIPVTLDKNGGIKSNSVVLSVREFEAVKARMKEIIAGIGDELCSGEIEPNPYMHKSRTACDWCDYKSVCAFDEERTDDRMRELCSTKLSDVIESVGGEDDE